MILISGEALVDLIPDRFKDNAYDAVLGGSPYNVAIGLGRLGAPAAFVSRLSADPNGQSLAAALKTEGVDLSHVATDTRLKRDVAVKVLPAKALGDEAARQRVLVENPAKLYGF